jgi:hypothetical protein
LLPLLVALLLRAPATLLQLALVTSTARGRVARPAHDAEHPRYGGPLESRRGSILPIGGEGGAVSRCAAGGLRLCSPLGVRFYGRGEPRAGLIFWCHACAPGWPRVVSILTTENRRLNLKQRWKSPPG